MTARCDICEQEGVTERLVDHKFAYGSGPEEVILQAKVLIFECASCEEALMGWEGMDAMDEAIRQHRSSLAAVTPT